jgi:hypothetical protein
MSMMVEGEEKEDVDGWLWMKKRERWIPLKRNM